MTTLPRRILNCKTPEELFETHLGHNNSTNKYKIIIGGISLLNNKFTKWSIILICVVVIVGSGFVVYTKCIIPRHKIKNNTTINKYVKKEDNSAKNTTDKKQESRSQETIDTTEINNKIVTVKSDTIKTIVRIHEWVNGSVGGNNIATNATYKSANEYAKELNQVANNESWDYIKFDLQRAALNLQYASVNHDKQSLLIAHRILHDLDVHVFNKNDENAKKKFFWSKSNI